MPITPMRTALIAIAIGIATPVSATQNALPESRMAEATRLSETGRHDELQALLEQLLAEPEPHLEALFLSGMQHARAGRYRDAAETFRRMLVRDPRLIRPRLELALALQKAGDLETARYHYEQVLAAGLPPPVQRNIYRQLTQIRERLPSVHLTLELTSDSNPRQSTHNRVVYIGGLPYTLNDGNQARKEWGLSFSVDAHIPLPSDPRWFARIYGEAQEYPGRKLDAQYLHTTAGRRFEFGQHHLSLEAGGHASIRESERQYHGTVIQGTGFLRITPNFALSSTVSSKALNYADLPYLSSELRQVAATAVFVPAPTQRWDIGMSLAHNDAREDAYTYTQAGASVRYLHEWRGGWITGARVQLLRARYDAPDPFFGEVRHDRELRTEFDVLNRRISWWSFSPRLVIGHTKRDSSIALYDYTRSYIRAGLSRDF